MKLDSKVNLTLDGKAHLTDEAIEMFESELTVEQQNLLTKLLETRVISNKEVVFSWIHI